MKRKIFSLTIFIIIIIVGLHKLGVVFFCYEGKEKGKFEAVVLDKYKINENSESYKIRIKDYKYCFIMYVSKNIKGFEVGDYISFEGEYINPEVQRNSGGFDYDLYLKSKGILGSFKTSKINKLNKKNKFIVLFYKIKEYVENVFDKGLEKDNSNLLKGIILGEKNEIDDNTQEMFRDASLSHVLVISGAHFSYIVLLIDCVLKKYKNKRIKEDIKIILIILFINLVGFTPSIIRASFMAIYLIVSKKVYRRIDFFTAISISLLLQIIYNPYVIFDNGLMLSYCATIGIVILSKLIKRVLKFEILSTTVAANVLIFPITMYYFNTISLSFFISNILISFFLGPVIIGGIVLCFIPLKICYFSMNLILNIMNKIVELCSKIPCSKVYMCTPNLLTIVCIYLLIYCIYNWIISEKRSKKVIKNILVMGLIFIIFTNFNYEIIIANLKQDLIIDFIDVGQGDCTLLRYRGKKVLIDCGGSYDDKYDVGYKTTLPCILDKKIKKLDYLMFSHFDADHAQGSIALLDNIKVENIIVGKNIRDSKYYKIVKEKSKNKGINLIEVGMGDSLNVNGLLFYIIHPGKDEIEINPLNNNSVVCKAVCNHISILFTGDIEKEAEEEILRNQLYINNSNYKIKSDIIKIAHHGSNSSSTEEFLRNVNPRIALIGVGKDNKFGHPNDEVINRLELLNIKVFRTDKNGEITLIVRKGGKLSVKEKIKV